MKLINITIIDYYDGITMFTANKVEGTFSSEQIYFFILLSEEGDYIGIGYHPNRFDTLRKKQSDMRDEFADPNNQKFIGKFTLDGFTAYPYKGKMTEDMLPGAEFYIPLNENERKKKKK